MVLRNKRSESGRKLLRTAFLTYRLELKIQFSTSLGKFTCDCSLFYCKRVYWLGLFGVSVIFRLNGRRIT